MPTVEIYTKRWCGFCRRAKALLDQKGVVYREFDVTTDVVREREMVQRAGRFTVPQIFIDGQHLGGNDDLVAANRTGRLGQLLHDNVDTAA